ncbi:MAG: hypothetical protein SVU69_12435 [Pseudomonadota bacterium]|nr:hypothetical protein [Pseudomonadota bacterium]
MRTIPSEIDIFPADFARRYVVELSIRPRRYLNWNKRLDDARLGRRYMPVVTTRPTDKARFIAAFKAR